MDIKELVKLLGTYPPNVAIDIAYQDYKGTRHAYIVEYCFEFEGRNLIFNLEKCPEELCKGCLTVGRLKHILKLIDNTFEVGIRFLDQSRLLSKSDFVPHLEDHFKYVRIECSKA